MKDSHVLPPSPLGPPPAPSCQPIDPNAGIPLELTQLEHDLTTLSRRIRSLSIELLELVRRVRHLLDEGCTVRYYEDHIEIERNKVDEDPRSGLHVMYLQDSYLSFRRRLTEAFELQLSLQRAFAELPKAIVTKLPQKNGSPWRSHYLRECIDVLRKWPPEVEKAELFLESEVNTDDLIRVAGSRPHRPGFKIDERFEGFALLLEEAAADLTSLRFEFDSPSSDVSVQTGTSTSLSAEQENSAKEKKIKPTPATLAVIREIEKGADNDQINKITKASVRNISQIRSRFKNGKYVL